MVKEGRFKSKQSYTLRKRWGMKGQPSRKSIKYLQLHCRGKCECFRMVLWSGRVAHKVTFFVTRGFPELVPTVLLWWGSLGAGSSAAHTDPFPPSRGLFSCVLIWQLHCSFIPGGPSLHCFLSPLTKNTLRLVDIRHQAMNTTAES